MTNLKYFSRKYKSLSKLYEKASEITNVPAYFLAALHYRENAFRVKSPGPGGPFQFDPPLSQKRIRQLLTDYTMLQTKTIEAFINKGQNNIFVAMVLAGCFVQAKLKYDNKPFLKKKMNSSDNKHLIMRAFELYNGTAYGSYWRSPYVVNMLDKKHNYMRIRGTYIDRYGVRRRVNTVDKRPGAYTVFNLLEGN